ncbi:MAG TPA: outer membrane protein assembly factor BamD [Bacteroidota bacterium]|nr:outer membrane protein assembly factor BamD [Bacteroidota bacterium]
MTIKQISARSILHYLSLLLIVSILSSCGGSDVTYNLTPEEYFERGKMKFDEGSYLEAINDFEVVKIQFMGSGVADDAQYYLAECHFQRGEYLLAAEEYKALKRNMSVSSFIPIAQYKIGLSYYQLSPKSSLDQRFTLQAINEFQTFIEYNPTHELVPDAEAKIKELNSRLAQKLYDTAVLYMKMEYYKAAIRYFSLVIEKYHDTPFAEPALLKKVQALVARKKFDDAKPEIIRFLEKYTHSQFKNEAESLRKEIEKNLQKNSAAFKSVISPNFAVLD